MNNRSLSITLILSLLTVVALIAIYFPLDAQHEWAGAPGYPGTAGYPPPPQSYPPPHSEDQNREQAAVVSICPFTAHDDSQWIVFTMLHDVPTEDARWWPWHGSNGMSRIQSFLPAFGVWRDRFELWDNYVTWALPSSNNEWIRFIYSYTINVSKSRANIWEILDTGIVDYQEESFDYDRHNPVWPKYHERAWLVIDGERFPWDHRITWDDLVENPRGKCPNLVPRLFNPVAVLGHDVIFPK